MAPRSSPLVPEWFRPFANVPPRTSALAIGVCPFADAPPRSAVLDASWPFARVPFR
ncbi:hypothetical protein [Actinophytocola algeriensis]|uniref:hypothetical protein n=1 Tax=Actinophytocola algeriensis TaxID=1768010 RepID=UPI00160EED3C|nr:hypothetical protein [Actinophytocola algeriensis]